MNSVGIQRAAVERDEIKEDQEVIQKARRQRERSARSLGDLRELLDDLRRAVARKHRTRL